MASEKEQITSLFAAAGIEGVLGENGEVILTSPTGNGESMIVTDDEWFLTLDDPAKSPLDD
jgi:hypothetical protein